MVSYPADNSSSKITVSTSRAWIAVLISATLPDPMYVLGFGAASLRKSKRLSIAFRDAIITAIK